MNYLKLAICVGIFIIGFGVAWSWQGARLDAVKTEYQVCKDANAENTATITALQAEKEKMGKTCEARLNSKDALIRKLKKIENMGKKDEKVPDSPDDILNALNGMWDSH